MDAPVTFVTELVSVNWLLRFEFVMEVPTAESKWTGGECCCSPEDLRSRNRRPALTVSQGTSRKSLHFRRLLD